MTANNNISQILSKQYFLLFKSNLKFYKMKKIPEAQKQWLFLFMLFFLKRNCIIQAHIKSKLVSFFPKMKGKNFNVYKMDIH